jgi:hypothetical protein
MEICKEVEPPTVFVGNKNHGVACHLITGEKS